MLTSRTMTGRALRRPGLLLGFSLGGFFDGILLHQILQWHHLLSNVEAVSDMRGQIMADGLFHALMYVIAAIALYTLWTRRAAAREAGATHALWGSACVGFGAWHIVDGIVSHWAIGIHRIKIDSANPLMWDLIWFFAFGVVPAVLGWLVLRSAGGGGSGQGRTAASSLASLAIATLLSGTVATVPARDSDQVMVMFAPGVSPGVAFHALAKADARVLWVDRSGGLWAVKMTDRSATWRLYLDGAVLVSNSTVALGCLSWTKAA